jgi:hypothetical protein
MKKILLKLDLEVYNAIKELAETTNRDISKQIRSLIMSEMNNYTTNDRLETITKSINDIKDFNIKTVVTNNFTKDLLVQLYCDLGFRSISKPSSCNSYQEFLKNRRKDRFND